MRKYIIAIISVFLLLWIAFATRINNSDSEIHEVINSEFDKSAIQLEKSDSNLYIVQNKYKLSMYEPDDGCYIGAYVLGNRALNYNMNEFEEVTGRRHGIYIYNLVLGNPFPTEWILECIANMKTPLIVIHPREGMTLNENFLYDTAKSCGQLSVPMFVEFYPNPEKYNILPDEYKEFYKKAEKIFNNYSSNSAFIWSVNINNVYNSNIYYPGDDIVDWVGLSIYEPIYRNNVKCEDDIWSKLDFFYNSYQKSKPIMITQLAVSHYSDIDHTYYINEAKDRLSEFYNTVKNDYPRIKAINYMDFKDSENYKITDNDSLTSLYKSTLGSDYFKYNVDLVNSEYGQETFRSAFSLCSDGENIYISDKALKYELEINPQFYEEYTLYNNTKYYPLDIIKKYKNCSIKFENSKIYIN